MGKKDKKDAGKKEAKALRQAAKATKGEKKSLKVGAAGEEGEGDEEDIDAILNDFREKEKLKTAVSVNVCPQPSRRSHFSLTSLPNGDMLMFGGEYCDGAGTNVFNELYRWNIEKNEWRKIESLNTPAPRCSHQAVFYNDKVYVFGGEYATLDQFHHYRDLWSLDLKTNAWTEIKPTGDCPSARSGHRMVVWRGYIVLFGGFFEVQPEVHWYNDLYLYSFQEEKWTQVRFGRLAQQPRVRSGHQMTLHPTEDVIYVQGGLSKEKLAIQKEASVAGDRNSRKEATVHDDLWALDLKPIVGLPEENQADISEGAAAGGGKEKESSKRKGKDKEKGKEKDSAASAFDPQMAVWNKISRKGANPSSRCGSAMCYFKNKAILFGGVFDEEQANNRMKSIFHNDIYSFDLTGKRWYEVQTDSMKSDMSESLKESTVLSSMMDNATLSDGAVHTQGYLANYFSKKWSSCPCPRINACLIVKGNKMFVYGGVTEIEDVEIALDDCWSLDLSKPQANGWSQVLQGTMSTFVWRGPVDTATDGTLTDDEDDDDGGEDKDDAMQRMKKHFASGTGKTGFDEEDEDDEDEGQDEGDIYSLVPKASESLREFYNRTTDHWMHQAEEGEDETDDKSLKRAAFALCEALFKEKRA